MTISWSNTVTINDPSNSIASITYVDSSVHFTNGQPCTPPPKFTHSNNVFTVTLQAGRSNSTPPAQSFNQASGGAANEYAPSGGGGGVPSQLNFWFSLVFNMQSNNGQTVTPITINIGQGSYGTTNNWWIGGANIVYPVPGKPAFVYSDGTNIYTFALSGDQDTFTLTYVNKRPVSPIKNVFVLMLENHSFDNMLAMSGISGINAATSSDSNTYNGQPYNVGGNAPSLMPTDPGHEFTDVVTQLCGEGATFTAGQPYPPINNSGFAANYATTTTEGPAPPTADIGDIMLAFNTSSQMPAMYSLASNYVVCDNWYSSLPGPTWPNRFFLHGASSNGLDHSPSKKEMGTWEGPAGFTYPKGSIFDQLNANLVPFKLYQDHSGPVGGWIAQVSAIKNIKMWGVSNLATFESDLSSGYDYAYTFIEPAYGDIMGGTYAGGSSQHPMDGVAGGESLIEFVYTAIYNSPLWNQSLLIITYDEHGGFYDHVLPGQVTGPNDGSNSSSLNKYGFQFTTYGVRVPAIIVSPLLAAGVDPTLYDHTSVLATIEWLFGVPALTARDGAASVIKGVKTASSANLRANLPATLGAAAPKPRPPLSPEAQAARDAEPVPDGSTATAFLGVLLKADSEMAATPQGQAAALARYEAVKTRGHARAYAEHVMAKVRAMRAIAGE